MAGVEHDDLVGEVHRVPKLTERFARPKAQRGSRRLPSRRDGSPGWTTHSSDPSPTCAVDIPPANPGSPGSSERQARDVARRLVGRILNPAPPLCSDAGTATDEVDGDDEPNGGHYYFGCSADRLMPPCLVGIVKMPPCPPCEGRGGARPR